MFERACFGRELREGGVVAGLGLWDGSHGGQHGKGELLLRMRRAGKVAPGRPAAATREECGRVARLDDFSLGKNWIR